jgi:hypothetical protein
MGIIYTVITSTYSLNQFICTRIVVIVQRARFNLTPRPTTMIILDVWFNPAVHRQVEARINRIGTTKPVKVAR